MQRKPVRSAAPHAFTAIAVPVALVLAAAGAAHAQVPAAGVPIPPRIDGPHPPIVLALDPCADLDAQEVRRLLPIEMGAPIVGRDAETRDTTRVTVGCVVDSPSVVRLEVREPATGRMLDRFITLLGVPKTDQARLVAIAAVELVAASWSDRARVAEPPPRAPDAGVKPAADLGVTTTPPPAPRERRWRLSAVASLRHFGGLPDLLPGGGLALQHVRRRFVVGADAVVEGNQQSTALGGVDSLLASGSLTGAARLPLGPLTLEAGGGARAGVARLAGARAATVITGTVTAPWIGPLGVLRAVLELPRGFALSLGGEIGWATAGVIGGVMNAPDLSVRGTWWGASLGVAYAY